MLFPLVIGDPQPPRVRSTPLWRTSLSKGNHMTTTDFASASTAEAQQRARVTKPWPRRRRRGLSLPGTILAVAIAAVAAGGVVAAGVSVQTNVRAQQAQQLLTTIESKIRETYATLPQFDADMTDVALSSMPASAIQTQSGSDVIVTPWGGLITVGGGATAGTGAASGDRFWIAVAGLPAAACERIAQAYLNTNTVVGIEVLGTTTDSYSSMATAANTEAFDTVAEIVAECDGGSDDQVGIVFRS